MHRGYIKLWRKIQDWEWYDDLSFLGFFIHLILEANHKESKYKGHLIGRGCLVCGRKSLAERFNVGEQTIRTWLTRLKSTNEITTTSTNDFTIVSILNYEKYQDKLTNDQPTSQPTTNQRLTTSKEVKNVKNKTIQDNPLFYDFWKSYPRREGYGRSKGVFNSLGVDSALLGVMLKALDSHKKTDQWKRDGGKYIPYPATWLRDERWKDEIKKTVESPF